MNIAEWILVIMLAITLFIFLVAGIVLIIKLIHLANEAKKIVMTGQGIAAKADDIVDNVKGMTSVGGIVRLLLIMSWKTKNDVTLPRMPHARRLSELQKPMLPKLQPQKLLSLRRIAQSAKLSVPQLVHVAQRKPPEQPRNSTQSLSLQYFLCFLFKFLSEISEILCYNNTHDGGN